MRTKTLALALTLAVITLAASATYVLAHPSSRSYYGVTGNTDSSEEDWWNEMRAYMETHWEDHEDDEWWTEMREHMEQRWDNVDDDDWWNEMKEHMEERWSELEDGSYRYGPSSSYGGYGRCGGWRW